VSRPAWLGFEILHPAWAPVLLAVPLLFAFGWWALRARARARAALVSARALPRFLPLFSENRARLRVLLATAAALFLGLALLGPVRGFTLRDVQRRGLDLVVCLDTSRSMLVQDIKPDRLTRARREIQGLLAKLQGDRAALLCFSGDVRDVAPLTHDHGTLSAFGAVLERALALFDGRTGAHEAVVLLTDGEDLEGRGLAVARKAQERGIRIYVVGVGTQLGGKIPDGRGFQRDEQGQEVVSGLDGKTLQQIAEVSGGAYLSAEGSAFPLQELYEKRIAKLETRELFAGKERIPHDRYQWPLVLGALGLLGASGLRERRAREPRALPAAAPARWQGGVA
jgi:Ca-activated chloride channel homolog